MPGTNWRVANGLHGQVIGGEAVAAAGTGGGDWRNQLPSGSRHKIIYKIMETLKRHHPFSGLEGLLDLKRTALLFEENIFTAATSPTDYLRKISVRMLDFEMKSQNYSSLHSYATNNPLFTSGEFHGVFNNDIQNRFFTSTFLFQFLFPAAAAAAAGMEGTDWRTGLHPEARQRIVNKIVETLKTHLPFSGEEGLQELKNIAVRFEEYVYRVATGQSDYLRKISLKMLAVEGKSLNPMVNCALSTAASSSRNPPNPGPYPIAAYPPLAVYAPIFRGPAPAFMGNFQ